MYTAYYDATNQKLKTYQNDEFDACLNGCMPYADEYVCSGETCQKADLNLIKFMETLRDRIEQDIENAKDLYNQNWPETPLKI